MARALLCTRCVSPLRLLPLTLFTALAAAAPGAAARPLTLAEAVEESRAHGFDLLAAEAAVAQARGDLTAAAALPNPTLSLTAGPSLGCFGDGCRSGAPTLGAQLAEGGALWQLLVGKRGLRTDAARAALEAAEAGRDDVRRQADALVRQQFVSTVVAERALAFATEVRDSNARTLELMRQRSRAGAVDEADVSRIETQHLEAEQAWDAAVQALAQQRSALAFLLGRGRGEPVLLDADGWLDPAPLPALEQADLETLVAEAVARRPDVKALEAGLTQARAALDGALRSRVPDLALSVGYSQQGLSPDYSSPPSLTFGLSLPLPVAYQQDGEVARARATVTQAEALLDRGRAQARADVESALAAYRAAAAQARRMKLGLLQAAGRARALVWLQYDKGAASLLEYLDAQRTFVAINVESLSVVQAFWTAVFRLEAALGQELHLA